MFVSFQKKLKHKLDNNSAENQQQIQKHAARVYSFDDDDGPTPPKTQATATSTSALDGGISSSVSVHIVHQINNGSAQTESKISTNVTVNQTIKSQTENSDPDVQANIECKEEANEDNNNQGDNDVCDEKDLGIDDLGIEQILQAVENGKDIPSSLKDELSKFDEILNNINKDSDGSDSGLKTSESSAMFASDMYMDPTQSQAYRTPPAQHSASQGPMPEGGLAAEALKRMATQHQQHQPDQFGVKSAIDPFSDMSETGNFNARNGYPHEYYSGNMQNRSSSAGPYPQAPGGMGYQGKQALPGYSQNNKQLAPYGMQTPSSQSEAGPSSLQQLQNQVAAHFNHGPGPQMEITQTQHMAVSDGSHRMQMSQTQQIHLRQPPFPNISLTQQQGFSASPSMGPGHNGGPNTSQSQSFMNDQMLQQQQMMQAKMHPDQRQAHMQQYVNRPPPEYKMQNGMGTGMNGTNNMGPNPLQTIQNMVNQTNTQQNQVYSSVKSESNDMQNGMRSAQMSAMQQQQMGMTMSQAQFNYSNQTMQRQASFPGAMTHPMAARAQRQNSPAFTSAIMRNQRPPNVNIGPDGLNISQPRMPQEWGPRGMNPMTAQGPRPGVPATSASMMHYRSFSTGDGTNGQMQMHHQGQRTMHMETMQSQQAAMMQHSGSAHTQQMMMQQQRMQMSQPMGQGQGSHPRQTPPYSMTSQPGQSYPPPGASQDDLLNLLDNAPNQNTDFFDVRTSVAGSEDNWCDIEDILGKT